MSDLNLAINIKAVDNASSALSSLASGIGGNFSSAFGNIKFALQNIGTQGSLSKDALVAAGGDMAKALAGVAVAATGAAIAVGTKAVQAASDFQAAMIKSQAEAGLTKQQMTDMGNAILDMAPKVGKAPVDLANGLFFLESAGFAGKDALNALQISAQMASNDMTDTATVTKGLKDVVKSFGLDTSQSAFAANQMTVTVANGTMTMSDYANVIGKVALTAHGFGVSMAETNAGLDTLTNNGFPSATKASTALNALLLQFDGNTKTVAKNVRALGGSFDENKFKSMNLQQQIQYLSGAMKGHEDQLKKVLGGSQTAAAAFQGLSTGAAGYQSALEKLNNAQKNGGAEAQAFAATQQGFAFQMTQAKAAVDSLMIKIGQALLPVLSGLMQQVTPLIVKFTDWAEKHHVIENVANTVGAVLGGLVNIIKNLATAVINVVHFFQQHETAMNALKAVLITVGLLILAIVVPAFISWAIAAGSAAISTLILFAPLIALVAIISLVVFGIIEAVQHWGQIVAWLKGIWGGISSWFSGVLTAVKVWFVWLWTTIRADASKAWQAIQNAFKVALAVLVNIVMGPIFAIAGFFVWLYNHNIYFKQLIDSITNIIKAGLAWLQGAWQFVVTWIVAQWNALVVRATAIWDQVSTTIHDKFTQAIGFVQSVWTTISTFFVNAWNTYIAGPLTTLWTNVSSVFSSAWNTYIAGPLGGIWNSVSTWFTNLGTGAANSGKNFINMLVSGITSGAGAIWNAVVNIANSIWRALGFHSPAKEGPGADADKWMPNLVNMLSSDLTAGIPKIQAAVNLVAKPLATLGTAAQTTGTVAAPQTTTNNGGDIAIHVHLNGSGTGPDAQRQGKSIADVVKRELAKNLRQQSIAPRYTSGGTHN